MKSRQSYIVAIVLVLLGVFAVVASKVLLYSELNGFWRIFIEIGGYMLIAAGIGAFGKPRTKSEAYADTEQNDE